MALFSGGTMGTGTHSTSASSFTHTTASNALAAGNFAILTVVTDNIQTTTGPSTDHTGVTGTNFTATKLGEHTNGQGAAAAGITTSIWLLVASGSVPTGTIITITLSGNVVDKVSSLWRYTSNLNRPVRISAEPATNPLRNETNAAANLGAAQTFTGLSTREWLFFRGFGKEANSTTALTPTTNFSIITAQRSRNNASAVIVRGEWRIVTTGGSVTSNPTMAGSSDGAGMFFALEEYDPNPSISVQPTNQSVTEPATATFTLTAIAATTYQWQKKGSGGGGGYTAIPIGDPINAAIGNGTSDPAVNITVPPGCNACIFGGTFYTGSAGVVSTFEGSFLPANSSVANGNLKTWHKSGVYMGGYVGFGKVTATGSQNIRITHTNTFDEGPTCVVQFLNVGNPDDFVRDFQFADITATPQALSVSLNTAAGDLVYRYAGSDNTTYDYSQAGFTQVGTSQLLWSDRQTLWKQDTSVDGPITLTTNSGPFPTLMGISVKNAGGSDWANVTTGTGGTTSTYTTAATILADSGSIYRCQVSNSYGTVTSNEVTLTVTASGGVTGIKVWNGTSWVTKPVKVWNGTSFVTKPLKRWNGTAWV